MSVISIVCANCGAKYKLPETFQGDKAKCKACGTVIDVAAQRTASASASAGAAAAKAAPARAVVPTPTAVPPDSRARPIPSTRPAKDAAAERTTRRAAKEPAASRRSGKTDAKEAVPSRRAAAAPATLRRGHGRDKGEDAGSDGGHGRRGAREKPKSNTGLLIGGVIALLAIVLVILGYVFFTKKPPAEAKSETANEQKASATGGDQGKVAAETGKPQPGKEDASAKAPAAQDKPADASSAAASGLGALASEGSKAGSDAGKPSAPDASKGAEPKDAVAKKPAPDKSQANKPAEKILTMAEVFDPKTLDAIDFPANTPDETKKELNDLMQQAREGSGSASTTRALRKLAEHGSPAGYLAMVPMINELRTLDYSKDTDSMYAYMLNKELEDMSGRNTGFKPTPLGEPIELKTVDWNAKTVKVWCALWNRVKEDPEAYKKMAESKKNRALDK